MAKRTRRKRGGLMSNEDTSFRLGFFQNTSNDLARIDESSEELYGVYDTLEDAKFEAFNRFQLDPTKWDDEEMELMSIYPQGEYEWYFIEWITL
jgi:hypothetical protein